MYWGQRNDRKENENTMKFSMKAVLRFLFPEIQIVDAIKQEEFDEKNESF